MKQANLLKLEQRINRSGTGHMFVQFRKVITSRSMECSEMDIKVVWIPNAGRNAYLLYVIDVYTCSILKDYFSFLLRKNK
ncbi:hypothetical protein [Wenyingzhuangia sp. IMCC45467]